jgi:predicted nucleotidyltransferase
MNWWIAPGAGRTEEDFPQMSLPVDELVDRARRWAERDERVIAAVAYGSVAQGTATEWSDLDLLVVTAAEQREVVWADRTNVGEEILGETPAFENQQPWQRPYRCRATRADLVAIDLSLDEEEAQVWSALVEGHVVLVDKADVAARLKTAIQHWQRPEFDAPTWDSGPLAPNTWDWLVWLAGRLQRGESWIVRYGVMETLNNRVIPLLGASAHSAHRELAPEDQARLHTAAPTSADPSELARSLNAVADLYDYALDRWTQRTGRDRPRHPLAAEIRRRLRRLPNG